MKTVEELEKDIDRYKKCMWNWSNVIDFFIFEEIENIQNKINYILFREKFEKKKD